MRPAIDPIIEVGEVSSGRPSPSNQTYKRPPPRRRPPPEPQLRVSYEYGMHIIIILFFSRVGRGEVL